MKNIYGANGSWINEKIIVSLEAGLMKKSVGGNGIDANNGSI